MSKAERVVLSRKMSKRDRRFPLIIKNITAKQQRLFGLSKSGNFEQNSNSYGTEWVIFLL